MRPMVRMRNVGSAFYCANFKLRAARKCAGRQSWGNVNGDQDRTFASKFLNNLRLGEQRTKREREEVEKTLNYKRHFGPNAETEAETAAVKTC